MNNETPGVSPDRQSFTDNAKKLENLGGGKKIDEMSDDETEAFLAERKKLKADNEGLKDKAQTEAEKIDGKIDEAKAAREKANKEVALAEQAKLQAEKDVQEADALLEKLKNGDFDSSPTQVASEVPSEVPATEPEVTAKPEAPPAPAETTDWREEQRISTAETNKRIKAGETMNWFERSGNSVEPRFKKLRQAYENLPLKVTLGDKPNAEYDELVARIEALKVTMIAEYKAKQEAEAA